MDYERNEAQRGSILSSVSCADNNGSLATKRNMSFSKVGLWHGQFFNAKRRAHQTESMKIGSKYRIEYRLSKAAQSLGNNEFFVVTKIAFFNNDCN